MKRRNSYYTEINPRSKFVYCRYSGGSYTTYDELFDAYPEITKYKDRYAHKSLKKHLVYKVLAEVPHEDILCNIFVLEDSATDEIFLCSNGCRYLAPINVNSPFVSDKTIKRILEAIKEVDEMYPFIGFSYSIIMGRTLCISFYNYTLGKYYKYIPNVAKMSTKDITKRIKKYTEESFKYE